MARCNLEPPAPGAGFFLSAANMKNPVHMT